MTGTGTGTDLHVDAEAVVALTRELVRIRSVHDPAAGGNEAGVAELVIATMRSFGWDPVIEEVGPGRPNVHAVVDGGEPGPTLLMEGHTDVVTEGAREDWSVDPFGGEVRDGRLYGRGAADMKGGVAAMLHAIRALQCSGPFPGRVKVAALVDEEGMMLGVKHFVAAGHASDVDAAIVCEPEAEEVCTTSKGSLRLRVDAYGRMAHGAMPQQARNPLPVLAQLLDWVAEHEAVLQQRFGTHEQLGTTSITPTVLRAGDPEQVNVIPGHGWLGLDVRTVPGVEHARLTATVARAAHRLGSERGIRTEVSVLDDRPATVTDADSLVVRAVVAAHRSVTGSDAVLGGVPGATDGTILWRDTGLPVVVYGPGGKWVAHQADEFVEVDDIVRKSRVYALAARHFLTGGG